MFSINPESRFWVVTYPTRRSVFADICFETDLPGLRLQFTGGLKAEDICRIEESESMAKQTACSLLGIAYPMKAEA